MNSTDFKNKFISKYIWAFALFDSIWNKNALSIMVIVVNFQLMCVSLIKENLQIFCIKMSLFKYFELYAHAYTSDRFNGKRLYCSEPPQADSREEASGTPWHISSNAYSRLSCKGVINLLASLQPTCNARL